MKSHLVAAALLFPVVALGQPKAMLVGEQIEAVVTVTKVDLKARTVTFRGPKGDLQTLAVPPESQNLDRVKPGDRFRMRYAEAAVVALTKGEQPPTVEETVNVAPKGAKPGGYAVRTTKLSATVAAIDHKKRQLSLRGPKGNIVIFPVSADVKNFDQIKVGDKVSVAYSEALALEMVAHDKK